MVTMPGKGVAPEETVRVMHVVYSLEPGGMELGVVKVVNGLDPSRIRSSICSTTGGGSLRHIVAPRVTVHELTRRKGNDPRLVWSLSRLFRRERPHIVHTHAWGTLIEGLVAARLAGVPAVVHGEHGTLQLRPHQRWFQRQAWSAVDRLLSVSSRLAERMSAETGLDPHRITTIRNGVDLSRFSPAHRAAGRASLGIPSDVFVAGTAGRLVPVKDQSTLMDAFAALRRTHAATLVLAGDGPLRQPLLDRARALGVDSDVRVLGHRRDVETVLAALDVFVLSSVSEGLSNTILEAMASGLPVVATRVGGADELVVDGETGVLVNAGRSGDIADALARLAADASARRAMGSAGRRRAETEFALSTMVTRYQEMYLDVAASKLAASAVADARSSTRPLAHPKRLS